MMIAFYDQSDHSNYSLSQSETKWNRFMMNWSDTLDHIRNAQAIKAT